MKQILVIDDDPQIRSFLETILSRENFVVLTASNGKKGMKIFKDNTIDLVLTDIIMPEKEGFETIREILEIRPNTPIIAMSGGGINSSEGYLRIAKSLGAYSIFEKPIEKEHLIALVKESLGVDIGRDVYS